MHAKLFVIRQKGRNLYWSCSTEHGCGWSDRFPKQAFSPSELTREIRRLIDENWFTGIEICELSIREDCTDGPQECSPEKEDRLDRHTERRVRREGRH